MLASVLKLDPPKRDTALLSSQNPSLGCLHAEPWSCAHLALLAVSSVKESLLPLNPFPKHFSSKSCLTKTIPLRLETAHCYQKQGSVNFKAFLWRRVFSNADVKGNRSEGNMSSAPRPPPVLECYLESHSWSNPSPVWSPHKGGNIVIT